MSETAPTRSELEQQVLESLTAESAAWLLDLPRTTFLSRRPPRGSGGYSGKAVVAWLVAAVADETTAPPGGPSPELEKWRAIRRQREEFELAARRGELVPAAVVSAMYDRAFAVLRAWASRIGQDNPAVFHAYARAVDDAAKQATSFALRPGCKRVLRLEPADGSEPVEIDLGTVSGEDVVLPSVEVHETRRCAVCNNSLSPSWVIETDGSETPVWCCHTLNCLVRLPRRLETEGAR